MERSKENDEIAQSAIIRPANKRRRIKRLPKNVEYSDENKPYCPICVQWKKSFSTTLRPRKFKGYPHEDDNNAWQKVWDETGDIMINHLNLWIKWSQNPRCIDVELYKCNHCWQEWRV